MSPVPVAYSHLRWSPAGIVLEQVYLDRERRETPIALRSGLSLDSRNHSNLVEAGTLALRTLHESLGVERITNENVALSYPPDWRTKVEDACTTAAAQLGVDLAFMQPSAAEAICFFDHWEAEIRPICREWVNACIKRPEMLDGTGVTLDEFRSAVTSLESREMTVAVVGGMKAGKSTFLNALLGQFVMPALDKRCTRRRFNLYNQADGKPVRRVSVWRWRPEGREEDLRLAIDVDDLGWTSEELRSYLFALNAPGLLQDGVENLDPLEKSMIEAYGALRFGTDEKRKEVDAALRSSNPPIETIQLAHPFWGLSFAQTGRVQVWDTPGPDAIEDQDQDRGLRRTDSQTFEHALRESSAVIVLFDVTRNESAAQDEVLKRISTHRSKSPDSVVLLANKVDQRQVRNVEPLDSLLASIRANVGQRYNLRLRPVLPVASRPAQLAREMLSEIKAGREIDDKLQEDYDTVERPSDRKADPDCPPRAVEVRSRIAEVETLLGRFFRQDHGKVLLQGALGKTLTVLHHRYNVTQLRLAGLGAKQAELDDAVAKLAHAAPGLERLLDAEDKRLSSRLNEAISSAKQAVEASKKDCLNKFGKVREDKVGARSTIPTSEFAALEEAFSSAMEPAFSELRAGLARQFESGIVDQANATWSVVNVYLQDREREIGRSLGVELGKLPLESKPALEFVRSQGKQEVARIKQTEHVGTEPGLVAGGVIGGGMGVAAVVGALFLGPVGWVAAAAVLAGAAATGAGVGGAVGYLGGDVIEKELVKAAEVKKVYEDSIGKGFEEMKNAIEQEYRRCFAAILSEVKSRATRKTDELRRLLAECAAQANDANRAATMKSLQDDLNRFQRSIPKLSEAALRLGLSSQLA